METTYLTDQEQPSWVSSKPPSPTTTEEQQEQDQTPRTRTITRKPSTKKKKTPQKVLLEGYVVEANNENNNYTKKEEDQLKRAKSLTDEDLDELKGCLDLGFGFNYDEIPELCNTLPALELCYSMSQKYLDDRTPPSLDSPNQLPSASSTPGPVANWKISSPGDHPEDVKARLKFWAQTVACTVRLCN